MLKYLDFVSINCGRWQAAKILWNLYPKYSLPRRLICLINIFNQLGPRFCKSEDRDLIGSALSNFPSIDDQNCRVILLHKLRQKHRFYVFDFNQKQVMLAAAKIATTSSSAIGLFREKNHLINLSIVSDLNTPQVVAFTKFKSGAILRRTVPPSKFTQHKKQADLPYELLDAISNLGQPSNVRFLPAEAIQAWVCLRQQVKNQLIRSIVDEIKPDSKFRIGSAHGDLGSENVFSPKPKKSLSDFFVIDWEFFNDSAPILTDQVGYWLGKHHSDIKGFWRPSPRELTLKFLKQFEPKGLQASVIALLYLAYTGIDLAVYLITKNEST